MSTWRQHDFREGARYRVRADIKTATSHFALGEIAVFTGASHSCYDSSSAFMFRSESAGEIKTWFLRDDEEDRSKQLFEIVVR